MNSRKLFSHAKLSLFSALLVQMAVLFTPQHSQAQTVASEAAGATAGLALFSQPEGKKLSVMVLKPLASGRNVMPDQEAAIIKVNPRIDALLTQVSRTALTELGGQLVSSLSDLRAERSLDNVRNALKARAQENFAALNADLPANNPLIYSLYLMPIAPAALEQPGAPAGSTFEPARWQVENRAISLVGRELPLHLLQPENAIGKAALYARVRAEAQASLEAVSGERFQVAAIVVQVKLQRDQSEVKLQVLSGLVPTEIPFAQENEQVAIEQIAIARPQNQERNLSALLSLRMPLQEHRDLEANPLVALQFGVFGGVDGGSFGNWEGSLKVERVVTWADGSTDNLCDARFENVSRSVLSLEGALKKGGIENRFIRNLIGDWLERQNPRIRFRIFDIYIDATDLRIAFLNVRVDVSSDRSFVNFSCMNQKLVREQLEGEFNSAIQETLGIRDTRGQELALGMFNAVYSL